MDAVAVTGMGVFCSIGRDVAEFRQSLLAGRAGLSFALPFDATRYRCRVAYPAPPPPQPALVRRSAGVPQPARVPRRLHTDVFKMARAALAEAVDSSRLPPPDLGAPDTAFIVATTLGHLVDMAGIAGRWAARDLPARWPPSTLLTFPIHALMHMLAAEFGFAGRTDTVCSACASGGAAIALAVRLIQAGEAARAVVVGVEPLSEFAHAGFDALMLLDPAGCRPLCGDGTGLTLGAAAAALVLEPLAAAQSRGAAVPATVAGIGMSCDAVHPAAPDPSGRGPVACLTAAAAEAGAGPAVIGYVNCHGTGTRYNDEVELAALAAVFPAAENIVINSTKGLVGHTLGASGVIEALVTVLALADGLAHPNRIPGRRRIGPLSAPVAPERILAPVALSNSFGFGGFNVTLALTRPGWPAGAGAARRPLAAPTWLTGLGLITALGRCAPDCWRAALAGGAPLTPAPGRPAGPGAGWAHYPAVAPDFAVVLRSKEGRRMDRLSRLAAAAAVEAASDAGLEPGPRVALVYGSGTGPMAEIIAHVEDTQRPPPQPGVATVSPARFINSLFSAGAGYVAIELGLVGPVVTLAAGGVTGLHALSCADVLIRSRVVDAALVVVADEVSPPLFYGYGRLGLLSRRGASLPFDSRRDGFVLGEAAAAVVLEAPACAAGRGRAPRGRFLGFSATTDGRRPFAPDPSGAGLGRAIAGCLRRAGVPPSGVALVVSGANATVTGDILEARGIVAALAGCRPPVTAPKSMVGETDGSWGVIAAVLAALAMADGVVPPTAGVTAPDPGCDIALVAGRPAPLPAGAVLITARSLPGHNAAALLAPPGGDALCA